VLRAGGREIARVEAALGSPARPLDAEALGAKVHALTGRHAALELDEPAASLLERFGL
jgi:hypothetical protein